MSDQEESQPNNEPGESDEGGFDTEPEKRTREQVERERERIQRELEERGFPTERGT